MFFGLDHIAVASTDLVALSRSYERLGFTLTPQSRHGGRLGADGKPTPGGTANRCVMLRRGYLELLGIVDATADTRGIPDLIARHAGLHIVAFDSRDPDADLRRLTAAGFETRLAILERDVVVDGRTGRARFTQVRVPEEAMPEARIFGLRHETPDLVWLPDCLDHPNGAVALDEVFVAVPDLHRAAARYERFLGVSPDLAEDAAHFVMPAGRLSLLTAPSAERIAPGIPLHPEGQALAFTVGVADLERTAALLQGNAVPFRRAEGRLVVEPHRAGRAGCMFRQHS